MKVYLLQLPVQPIHQTPGPSVGFWPSSASTSSCLCSAMVVGWRDEPLTSGIQANRIKPYAKVKPRSKDSHSGLFLWGHTGCNSLCLSFPVCEMALPSASSISGPGMKKLDVCSALTEYLLLGGGDVIKGVGDISETVASLRTKPTLDPYPPCTSKAPKKCKVRTQ